MTRRTTFSLLLLALAGCAEVGGDEGIRADDDPGGRSDGGIGARDMSSAPDAGPAADQGTSPPVSSYTGIPAADPDSIRVGGESATDDALNDIRSCYDGEDNDADSAVDCADPACFPVASCCVSSGRAECCTAPEVIADQSFDTCSDPAGCLDATVFGSPEPFVSGGALAMGGDSLYDSGVLVTAALDLRGERVELEATFRDTTTCSGCLDGAAFGVTAQASLDDQDHVEPLVALQRNAGGDVRLRVGPRTLQSFVVTEGQPFTLVLRPDGVGEVSHAGTTHSFAHTVGRVVHAVAWGYSSNPSASAPEGVFLDDLSIARSRCGAANGWRDRAPTGADEGRLLGIGAATDASGTHWLALDDMDGLAIGTIDESGAFDPQPLEVGTIPWGNDPRGWGLTHDGTDLWLTFLADVGELETAFGRARLNGDTFEPESEPFFQPSAAVAHVRWVVARGHELLVVDDGAVALFGRGPQVPGAEDVWVRLDSDLRALTTGAHQPDLHLTREGVWLLHVARPMGTRWVVELFASDELVAWRPMGVVLAGSGDLEDFDGLGASAPAVVTEGDALQLYYVGHGPSEQLLGGVRRWLGAPR